jgi:hypothetical protein
MQPNADSGASVVVKGTPGLSIGIFSLAFFIALALMFYIPAIQSHAFVDFVIGAIWTVGAIGVILGILSWSNNIIIGDRGITIVSSKVLVALKRQPSVHHYTWADFRPSFGTNHLIARYAYFDLIFGFDFIITKELGDAWKNTFSVTHKQARAILSHQNAPKWKLPRKAWDKLRLKGRKPNPGEGV